MLAIYTYEYKCSVCFEISLKVIVRTLFASQWMFFARHIFTFSALISEPMHRSGRDK